MVRGELTEGGEDGGDVFFVVDELDERDLAPVFGGGGGVVMAGETGARGESDGVRC